MNPKISVVLSTYNHLNYLPKALDSIFNQDPNINFELLITDDGSTDATWSYLHDEFGKYSGTFIQLFRHKTNLGVQKSYHELLSKAKGEYLIFVHSDDTYASDMLSSLLHVLEDSPDVGLAYGGFNWIDEKGEVIITVVNQYVGYHQLLVENPGMSAVLMRRSIYEKVGGYDPEIGCRADQDLYLRILEKSKAVYVNKILSSQRLDEKCKSYRDQVGGETEVSLEKLRAKAVERRKLNRKPGPPRILFVVSSLPKDTGKSLQSYINREVASLNRNGYRVSFLERGNSFNNKEEIIYGDYSDVLVYADSKTVMSQVEDKVAESLFIRFLDETLTSFDIIHFHHLIGFPMSLIDVAKKCGYPVVLSLYDLWMLCPELGNKACTGQISIDECAKCLMKGKNILYVNEIADYYYQVAYRRAYFEYLSKRIDIIIPTNSGIYNIFKNLGISHLDSGAPTLDEIYKELLR